MSLRIRSLLGITCLFLSFGVAAIVVPVAAQETTSNYTATAANSDFDNDHDRGPQNGDLAVSAVTIVDGAYATAL